MSELAPEFSRLVPLAQLGGKPFTQRIEATAEEREQLSRRFDLLVLDRLVAEVELRRQSAEIIVLEAKFEAEFEQCCAVTLEPVRGAVSDRFSLVYGPAPESQEEFVLSGDEPAFEPLHGDAIDIGEAVAQELSLALPVFPRDPDAVIDGMEPAEPLEGPFAALARLRTEPER
jgi:uncharacterized metal-binding protein YceD (DUF177 family)